MKTKLDWLKGKAQTNSPLVVAPQRVALSMLLSRKVRTDTLAGPLASLEMEQVGGGSSFRGSASPQLGLLSSFQDLPADSPPFCLNILPRWQ